jgi:ATP-dependent DNA helicase RecG
VVVTFCPAPGFEQAVPQATPEVTPEVARILPPCATAKSKRELQLATGIRDEKHFREAYLRPALEAGLLERTIPEKPQSSKQRYRLTAKGHEWLRQQGMQ